MTHKTGVETVPQNPSSAFTAATSAMAAQTYADAIPHLRACIPAHNPQHSIYFKLGICHQMTGDLDGATYWYQQTVAAHPTNKTAWFNMGAAMADNGDLKGSENAFRQAAYLDPDYEDPVAALAALQERRNKLEDAYETLSPLIQDGTGSINTILTYSRIERRLKMPPSQKDSIGTALENTHSQQARGALLFELAAIYDAEENYAQAFTCYRQANDAVSPRTYNPKKTEAGVEYLTALFPKKDNPAPPEDDQAGIIPVFIVGMPRSGTTLVHEILSAHPDVHGCGETRFVDALFHSLPQMMGCRDQDHQSALTKITAAHKRHWLQEYQEYGNVPATCSYFLDKMPANLFHLGLIASLWPQARVITCLRDDQDTLLSNFFQHYSTGHDYSYDLKHIQQYQQLQHRLWHHWKTTLTLRMTECRYEDLVNKPDGVIPELQKAIGLSEHENCRRHFDFDPHCYTASYATANNVITPTRRYAPYADFI
ncbi:hypothetical protein GCM10017044_15610 [Kordiimonas sediminis]|uniref:Sulfotransferase family protein n=1 Tax=Kordiimonas sediminis TaxID=1735581 RepID=A0A919E7V0_9PROT|nr:sulfotransferase [Kordiimonas sediminis]GHF22340.1 hypothetical protein GCM10017044_15610 [Kordiimonas sediminis]